ncbi:MAG: serine/threonine protein kinase [Anaerolineales bacterium]|nr:serine/threonine protein kinase [Anaerolineales bacterium]
MLAPLLPEHILRERYQIRQVVGRGGMGCVYQAEDLRLEGRMCAVKEIQPDPLTDPEVQRQTHEQFHREASVLARLDHPNLPKVSDFFSEGGRDFLVMDFVPGHDLKEIMDATRREGLRLPEERILEWADQLCSALEYMHRLEPPVLHRDIKPGNVKLTPGGLLKLVDFGLVKLMVPDETRTITVLQGRGTALYTPLEQYGGESGHTDNRSDIYSLGATLFHLLTNEPPAEAKQRFLKPESQKPIRQINTRVSEQTAHAIEWAMALHPDDRPSSVVQFRNALLGNQVIIRTPIKVPESGWKRAVKENIWLIAAATMLFVVAFLATLYSPLVPLP